MGSLRADEWSRVGEYLDRLAFENDRLEAELKIKKQRRLEREASLEGQGPTSRESRFDEIAANSAYEARRVTDATAGMHISYDALRSDLSGLMSDLNEFKSTRATLEARLGG
jgi:hypothetical protein